MKTAKSLLALLLSLIMILCFAACDEASGSPDDGSKTGANVASAPVTDASSEESVSSEEPAPLTSVVGVWDREENLMPTLKYGFAHDSKLAEIIKKSEIEDWLLQNKQKSNAEINIEATTHTTLKPKRYGNKS